MIKFFRKIRQKMLTENKFSKYFIYAIGEIVLVVIGILIALQINSYNNALIQENKIKNIYQEIYEDLETDISKFESTIKSRKKGQHIAQNIINGTITIDSLKANPNYLFVLIGGPEIVFNKAGYENLNAFNLNSESLQSDLNKKIKKFYNFQLFDFEDQIDEIQNSYNRNIEHFEDKHNWLGALANNDYEPFLKYAESNMDDFRDRTGTYYIIRFVQLNKMIDGFIKAGRELQTEIKFYLES